MDTIIATLEETGEVINPSSSSDNLPDPKDQPYLDAALTGVASMPSLPAT